MLKNVRKLTSVIDESINTLKTFQCFRDQFSARVSVSNVRHHAHHFGSINTILLQLGDGVFNALGVSGGDDDLRRT